MTDGRSWVPVRLVLLAAAAVLATVSAPWARVAYALALLAWIPDWFAAARPGAVRGRRAADILTGVVLLWLLA